MLEGFACESDAHIPVKVVPGEGRFQACAFLLYVRPAIAKLTLPFNVRLMRPFVQSKVSEVDHILWINDSALTSDRDRCQNVIPCRHDSANIAFLESPNDFRRHLFLLVLHDQESEERQFRLHFLTGHGLQLPIIHPRHVPVGERDHAIPLARVL